MRELDKDKLGKFLDKHKGFIEKLNIPEITPELKEERELSFHERRRLYCLKNKK